MYSFIVNPNARSGLGLEIWKQVEEILNEKNVEYKVYMTRYPEHASEFAKEITEAYENPTIIAMGGDGTVNEVMNGITDFSKVTLGYIPIGSSNDFARGLELPKDPVDALNAVITKPHLHPMNVG